MKKLLLIPLVSLLLGVWLALPPAAAGSAGETWVVSPDGPIFTIAEAVAKAGEGDTIAVYGGHYDGPLVVDKRLRLEGYDWPVIDGHGRDSVVELTAAGIHFEGFVVRDSGISLNRADAGIIVAAPEIIVANNRLEDVLFGVYMHDASYSVVRGNEIYSKELDVPRRGDQIRLWSSHFARLEDNVIEGGRDVVLWYSEGLVVRGNQISHGRYGLHLMYCDDVVVEENLFLHNSVGVFLMYSENLRLERNTIAFNRGPSGYGIGLKDTESPKLVDNLLLDNRVGIFMDSTARSLGGTSHVRGNLFLYNDVGLTLLPVIRGGQFVGNSFIDNQEQVSIAGGGQLQGNLWTINDRGNYWSDYAGYDAVGDGVGDITYRADRLFENLADRHPSLRIFTLSPAIQAVDFAARAFPFIRPQPKLEDEGPLMAPVIPANLPALPPPDGLPLGAASAGLMGLALALGLLLNLNIRGVRPAASAAAAVAVPDRRVEGEKMIEVIDLKKRFGRLLVLDGISFTVQKGEAVVLWGANGAGKTTALRCLLGVLPYEGTITIAGHNTALKGKTARRLIGFVPQELNFHDDLTIEETMRLYARLKRVSLTAGGEGEPTRIDSLLTRLDLTRHAGKQVRELSGGMKQRLALAIALLADPPILMLDEPTANLDVSAREDFLELLARQKEAGKTLVFSSHRPEEVTALADRVLALSQGQLAADLPPSELNGQVAGWHTQLYLSIAENELDMAMTTLAQHGFSAQRNGSGVKVAVGPNNKGRPISLLNQAGVEVYDFEAIN